jgi:putative polyhydroxyalkanoate system protein
MHNVTRAGTAMSTIEIKHAHSLPLAKARKAVEGVAVKLGEKFGLDYRWEGDTLHFMRSGVDGHIALTPKQVNVTAKLGFLLSAMKGPIESEIRRVLDERF